MQEAWVQFLGRGNPLEKEMATHSSILTSRIPWTEERGRPGESHGQRSLAGLENPMDRGVARVKHNLATKSPPLLP